MNGCVYLNQHVSYKTRIHTRKDTGEKKVVTRSNSNAQPHKPCDELPGHMVDAVTSSSCSFGVSGSSPTTVSARMAEDPGNFNSCKRSANGVIKPQEKYGIAIFN